MEKIFQPGEVIIEENSLAQSAYLIKSGKVEVSKKNQKGEKIVLSILGEKQIFGEMGLIDDKPRSATVTALEPTKVEEINRKSFNERIQKDPTVLLEILKSLFERLRCVNQMFVEEKKVIYETLSVATMKKIFFSGVTEKAKKTLNDRNLELTKFPFRVGREIVQEGNDFLVNNDLYLQDQIPYNVSRNHFLITYSGEHIYIFDRGSTLGTIVNGVRIGGLTQKNNLILTQAENLIILGSADSPFQFKVSIQNPNSK